MDTEAFDRDAEVTLARQFAELYERTPEDQRAGLIDDLWLVLEGGYGDHVYLTVPFHCLRDRGQLGLGPLLRELDLTATNGNEAALDHANVRLVRPRTEEELEAIGREAGATRDQLAAAHGFPSWESFVTEQRMYVPGGSEGGGQLEADRVWLHDDFRRGPVDWHARAVELLHLEVA